MSRFIVNDNGTVTDPSTGLMWQQVTAGLMSWEDAICYCERLSLGGHNDWRLPSIKELVSLVDYTRYDPAIDTIAFPDTVSSFYWSSITLAYGTFHAWGVDFNYGLVYDHGKSPTYYARAVRSGQSGSLDNLTISKDLAEIVERIMQISAKLRGGKL